MEVEAPILYRREKYVIVDCPYCNKEHKHGAENAIKLANCGRGKYICVDVWIPGC